MSQQQKFIFSDYEILQSDEYSIILVYALTSNVNLYLPYAIHFDKITILKADDTLNEVFVHLRGNDTFESSKAPLRLTQQYELIQFTTDNNSKWFAVTTYSSGSSASPGGSGGVTVHSALNGLLVNDHPQYYHVSGSNPIASNLNLRNFQILSASFINGVDILNVTASIDAHILDTNNPHATSIGNLDPGTLEDLNSILTNAVLDSTSSARIPMPHSASHLSGGVDAINIQQLQARGIPEGHLFAVGPAGGLTSFLSTSFAPNDHGSLNGLGDNDHPQYTLTSSFYSFSQSINEFTSSVIQNSSSLSQRISTWENQSSSITSSLDRLLIASSSFRADIGDLQASSGSFSQRISTLENASASFNSQIEELYNASGSFSEVSRSYTGFSASFVENSASWENKFALQTASIATLFEASSSFAAGGLTDISDLNNFSSSILEASSSWESEIQRLDGASGSYAAFSASFVGYSASWSAGTTDLTDLNQFSASILAFSTSHASRHLSGGADPIDAQNLRANGLGANRLLMTNYDGGWTTIPSSSVGDGGGATDITALNEFSASLLAASSSWESEIERLDNASASYSGFSSSFVQYSASWHNQFLSQTSSIVLLQATASNYASFSESLNLSDIAIPVNDGATLRNLEQTYNLFWSAGSTSGFDITNNGDGTITISSGSGVLRMSASSFAPLVAVSSSAATVTPTNMSTSYVFFEWNNGNPQIQTTVSTEDFNCQDRCILYKVIRSGSLISYVDARSMNVDGNRKDRRRLFETQGFQRVLGGSILGDGGTRHLTLSQGAFYYALNRINHSAYNTSVAGTGSFNVFEYYYSNGVGGWTSIPNSKQINNTQFDNGTGTLTSMNPNRFRTDWVYLVPGVPSSLRIVLGTNNDGTLAIAKSRTPPTSIPPILTFGGILVGRTIVETNATQLSAVESSFTETFGSSTITSHNELSNVIGGTYHLTVEEYNIFSSSLGNRTIQNFTASMLAASGAFATISSSYKSFSASFVGFSSSWSGRIQNLSSFSQSIKSFSSSVQLATASIQAQTASIQTFTASILAASSSWETRLISQTASIVSLYQSSSSFAIVSSSYSGFSSSFVQYSSSWSSMTPTDISALNSFTASIQQFTSSVQTQTASVQVFSASMLAASSSWNSEIERLDNASGSYAGFSASFVQYSASWSAISGGGGGDASIYEINKRILMIG